MRRVKGEYTKAWKLMKWRVQKFSGGKKSTFRNTRAANMWIGLTVVFGAIVCIFAQDGRLTAFDVHVDDLARKRVDFR